MLRHGKSSRFAFKNTSRTPGGQLTYSCVGLLRGYLCYKDVGFAFEYSSKSANDEHKLVCQCRKNLCNTSDSFGEACNNHMVSGAGNSWTKVFRFAELASARIKISPEFSRLGPPTSTTPDTTVLEGHARKIDFINLMP